MVEENTEGKTEEKRTYTQVLASLETHIIYINNHLKNIDSHQEAQNNRIGRNEIRTAKNTAGIAWIKWTGGILLGGGGTATLALYLAGVI